MRDERVRAIKDPSELGGVPHAVMKATRAEAALRNLETTAVPQNNRAFRHSAVCKDDLGAPANIPQRRICDKSWE